MTNPTQQVRADRVVYLTVTSGPCNHTFRDRDQTALAGILSTAEVRIAITETQRMRISNGQCCVT